MVPDGHRQLWDWLWKSWSSRSLHDGVSFPALVGEDDHQEPKEKERLVGVGQHVEQPCDRILDHCNGPGPSDSLELVLEWQLVVRVGIILAVEEDENHPVQ